jgi:hypothetical protein
MAPVSGAVRPRGRGLGRIAGAMRRVRRTTHHPHVWPRQPTGGPDTARHQDAVPGWPGEATPGGAGRRGWRRECGSRATTPTLCFGTLPRWCCGAAPRWLCAVVNPRWWRDATPRSCCEATPTWWRDATPRWYCEATGVRVRRPSCVCSRRVGPGLAWAGSLPYPRPEREAAADHPVPDAARVGALPGGAAHAPAVEADAAQVGLTAPARSDGGGGEPSGAHGSPSPLVVPCGLGPGPAAARGGRASV